MVHKILDAVLFLVIFFLIQAVVLYLVQTAALLHGGLSLSQVPARLSAGNVGLSGRGLIAMSVLSSVVTLVVFIYAKWAPFTRVWLASHPWVALSWVIWLALGTILPSQWLMDQMQYSMPAATMRMFESMMGEPLGYLALGILAPITEELVFRGAILRTLLSLFDKKYHWIPIALSAVVFGAVHGNVPQFVHASLMGLILGWMYYRTESISPGVVFHWINNTVAFVMFNLMPQMADGKLIDLFHGDSKTMWLGLAFSLCILIPSFFQLNLRLKRN